MKIKINSEQDFWSGIFYLAVGGFFYYYGLDYRMGEAARMGPGYFPVWLAFILMVIGLVLCVRAFWSRGLPTKVESFNFKVVGLITGGVCAFGLLLNFLGLYLSIAALVIIVSLASHEFTWRTAIGTSIFLIILCWAIFIWGINLQFQVWPPFLTN